MAKRTKNQSKDSKKRKKTNGQRFHNWSDAVSKIVGSSYWFLLSFILVLIWLPSGLFFDFNEIWHLLINTTTTILTFLMMSLLHASQDQWEKKMDRTQDREREDLRAVKNELEEINSKLKKLLK